ncbi:unnamed protein product [Pleuronectes platessa]|uniref:Uncharacterized protein n=1 Tax=Pleuronectes platessa TaxID=8262 RepID=A0A9N7VUR1_PLEPL|nr:unnamed protein product [Pleuronectes platessa]
MDQTEEIRSFDHLGPHVKHRATSSNYDMPSTASMAIDKGPSPSTSPDHPAPHHPRTPPSHASPYQRPSSGQPPQLLCCPVSRLPSPCPTLQPP